MADRDLSEESFGDLAKRLSEQTSTLVRQELALARDEMQQKGKRFGVGGGLVGAGSLLELYALALLLAGIVLLLIEAGIVAWLSAVIVAAVVAALGAVLALVGKKRVQTAAPPAPEQAIRSSKQDVEYLKQRARRR